MSDISLPKTPNLTERFADISDLAIHNLEPGNSLMFGYPESDYGQRVFLLTGIYPDQNGATAFAVNGAPCTSLSMLVASEYKMLIKPERDLPVFYGGDANSNQVFILTPYAWEPEIEGSIEIGPYRIHTSPKALIAILEDNRPDHLRILRGQMAMHCSTLCDSIRDNSLGEIAASDDLVFSDDLDIAKWMRAMKIHTGGQPLHIPRAQERPSLVLPEGASIPAPTPYMN